MDRTNLFTPCCLNFVNAPWIGPCVVRFFAACAVECTSSPPECRERRSWPYLTRRESHVYNLFVLICFKYLLNSLISSHLSAKDHHVQLLVTSFVLIIVNRSFVCCFNAFSITLIYRHGVAAILCSHSYFTPLRLRQYTLLPTRVH